MKFNLILSLFVLIVIVSKCESKSIRIIRDTENNSTGILEAAPVLASNSADNTPQAVAGIHQGAPVPRPDVQAGMSGQLAYGGPGSYPSPGFGGQSSAVGQLPSGVGYTSPGFGHLPSGVGPLPPGTSYPSPAGTSYPSPAGTSYPSSGVGYQFNPFTYGNTYNAEGYRLCFKQTAIDTNGNERQVPICVLITIPEFAPSTYTIQRQF